MAYIYVQSNVFVLSFSLVSLFSIYFADYLFEKEGKKERWEERKQRSKHNTNRVSAKPPLPPDCWPVISV